MPSFNVWLGGTTGKIDTNISTQNAYDDAETVGVRIAQRSSSIIITRAGSQLAAQTVRIEAMSYPPGFTDTPNSDPAERMVIIIGYKNHPTIADTNIQTRDRFLYNNDRYEVTEIVPNFNDRVVAKAKIT